MVGNCLRPQEEYPQVSLERTVLSIMTLLTISVKVTDGPNGARGGSFYHMSESQS